MTYPATRTFAKETTTDFDALTRVIEGQEFIVDGYQYRAKADAVTYTNCGFEHVSIDAERLHPAVPSGWELAAISAHRKMRMVH